MIELSIKSDIRDAVRRLGSVPQSVVIPSANRALNRAGSKVFSESVREVSSRTNIKPQRKVREAIKFIRSNYHTLRIAVRAYRRGINLIEFVAPSKRNTRAFRVRTKSGYKHKGVEATAWGKKKTYKHTFIGKGRSSGKMLVFSRTGKSRYPIEAKKGPSIPRTFIERELSQALLRLGRSTFIKEFERDAQYRMDRV